MKSIFCRIYSVCTNNIENRGGEPRLYMNEGTSGGFKEVFLKLAVKMFTELKFEVHRSTCPQTETQDVHISSDCYGARKRRNLMFKLI
jgi:hypothetical protein